MLVIQVMLVIAGYGGNRSNTGNASIYGIMQVIEVM